MEESSQRTDEKLEQKRMGLQGGVIIQGDVVRVEHDSYFVKEKGGEEVRLAIDRTTERIEPIKEGDRIVATVDKQNHALSIHKVP
jgi:ribosomal protein S1